jgi:uncharacterized beta-barrel protein YwiB (DUF1934 family)
VTEYLVEQQVLYYDYYEVEADSAEKAALIVLEDAPDVVRQEFSRVNEDVYYGGIKTVTNMDTSRVEIEDPETEDDLKKR